MKRFGILLLMALGAAVAAQAQKPANCSTSGGYPCAGLTWSAPQCLATVTLNAPVGTPPTQTEASGPCDAAVLRCMGGSCSAATLPALAGTTGALPNGDLGTGNGWVVLTQSFAQTTSASNTYYDNNGLAYGGDYNYVVLLEWTGSGGGVWSAYSNIFQLQMPEAPTPTLTPSAPSAATGLTATTV